MTSYARDSLPQQQSQGGFNLFGGMQPQSAMPLQSPLQNMQSLFGQFQQAQGGYGGTQPQSAMPPQLGMQPQPAMPPQAPPQNMQNLFGQFLQGQGGYGGMQAPSQTVMPSQPARPLGQTLGQMFAQPAIPLGNMQPQPAMPQQPAAPLGNLLRNQQIPATQSQAASQMPMGLAQLPPRMPQAPRVQQVQQESPRMVAMRNMQRMRGYNR